MDNGAFYADGVTRDADHGVLHADDVTLYASNVSRYAGNDSGDEGSAVCDACTMTHQACNPIRDGFGALRGAFCGMLKGNDAGRSGLGAMVSASRVTADAEGGIRTADGVGQFGARMAKQKQIDSLRLANSSVGYDFPLGIKMSCQVLDTLQERFSKRHLSGLHRWWAG